MLLAPVSSPSSWAKDEDEDEDGAPVEMIRVMEVPPEAEAKAEVELLLSTEVEDEPPPKAVETPSSLSTESPLEAWEGDRRKEKGKDIEHTLLLNYFT